MLKFLINPMEHASLHKQLKSLQISIHEVLVSHRNVVIHRCKTACLCVDLNAFHKLIPKKVKPGQSTSFTEYGCITYLLQYTKELYGLFQNLDENNYLQTLLKYDCNFVLEQLRKFRINFNGLAIQLNISPSDPLPLSKAQEAIDDKADCIDIIFRLRAAIQDGYIKDDMRETVNKRIMEFDEIVKQYSDQEDTQDSMMLSQVKHLTEDEVINQLSDLKRIFKAHEDFSLKNKIGSGGFADVYLSKMGNILVAVKKLKKKNFTQYSLELFKREITILSEIKHEAILPFIGIVPKSPYYIVTEYMQEGSLYTKLHGPEPLKDPTKLTIIAIGVAQALKFLHSKRIVHRDVKSLNVLLDNNFFPKLCDFGMSRRLPENNELMSGSVGTPQWMAPEVMRSELYTEKADVYSYGILLWELLTGDIPFKQMKDVQVVLAVLSTNARPMITVHQNYRIANLIRYCWDSDPNNRPDFEHICTMFDTGELDFPGSKREEVELYCNMFKEGNLTNIEFDVNQASEKTINSLLESIRECDKNASDSLTNITTIINHPKWMGFINENVVKVLIGALGDCPSSKYGNALIDSIEQLLRNEKLCKIFLSLNGDEDLMKCISIYGSTSIRSIIPCLSILIERDVKIVEDVFSKVSSFLGLSDISVRESTVKFISKVIDRKAYDSPSSLRPLIGPLLSESILLASDTLLVPVLNVIYRLSSFEEVVTSTSAYISNLLALLFSEVKDVVLITLKILRLSFAVVDSFQGEHIVRFISFFGSLSNPPNEIIHLSLCILAMLSQTIITYMHFSQSQNAIITFSECLKSEDTTTLIYSFKILNAMYLSPATFNSVSPFVEHTVAKLESDNEDISKLAIYALSTYFSKSHDKNIFSSKIVGKYLAMKLEHGSIDSLRFCGVISQVSEGAKYLTDESKQLTDLIINCLNKTTSREMAVMVLASISYTSPYSPKLLDAIEPLANLFKTYICIDYCLLFFANIALTRKGAIKVAELVPNLIDFFSIQNECRTRAMYAVQRCLFYAEAIPVAFVKADILVDLMMKELDGSFMEQAVDVLLALASYYPATGDRNIVKRIDVKYLEVLAENQPPTSNLRTQILRILSYCAENESSSLS